MRISIHTKLIDISFRFHKSIFTAVMAAGVLIVFLIYCSDTMENTLIYTLFLLLYLLTIGIILLNDFKITCEKDEATQKPGGVPKENPAVQRAKPVISNAACPVKKLDIPVPEPGEACRESEPSIAPEGIGLPPGTVGRNVTVAPNWKDLILKQGGK